MRGMLEYRLPEKNGLLEERKKVDPTTLKLRSGTKKNCKMVFTIFWDIVKALELRVFLCWEKFI